MIQKQLGQRIQSLRKERDISQEKFALQIDMDRTYLASVEAGKRNVSLCNIKKNCRWIECLTERIIRRN